MSKNPFLANCLPLMILLWLFHVFLDPTRQHIGGGSQGTVYKCYNINDPSLTPVAEKVITFTKSSEGDEYFDDILAELYLAPRLHSQYLVRILSLYFYHSDGNLTASVVMEYSQEGTLTSLKTEVSASAILFFHFLLLEGSRHSACMPVKGTKILKGSWYYSQRY